MNTLKYLIIICVGLIISSCSKNPNPVFIMENEAQFQIPAGQNTIETHSYIITNVPTFFKAFSGLADTSAILHLYPFTAVLKPKFESLDLDFIQSVNVYLLDPEKPESIIELFFLDFVEFGFKEEIRLFPSIVDVEKFMILDKFHIEVAVQYRQITTRTEDFILEMEYAAYDEE